MLVTLDTMGAKGPVTRREVAEEVVRLTQMNRKYWSAADEAAARMMYIQTQVARAMAEPHSEHIVERHMGTIPQQYRAALFGLPRFICISPGGGKGAQHVMALLATEEQWAANAQLKDRIVELSRISADESRSIASLLRYEKKATLSDVLGVKLMLADEA